MGKIHIGRTTALPLHDTPPPDEKSQRIAAEMHRFLQEADNEEDSHSLLASFSRDSTENLPE
jgi:hypothetical protein